MASKQPKIGAKIVLDGEKEYKQAVSGIGATQRILNSELEKTKAQYAGNSKSIEALTAKSGIYDKQVDKQKEKIETLQKALENAKNKFGETDDRTVKWQVSLNKAQTELYKLTDKLDANNKELEEAKKVSGEAADNIDSMGKESGQAGIEVEGLGESLKKNLTNAAVVAGIVLVADKLKDAAKAAVKLSTDAAAYADDILTLSAKTGIATDTLQELKYMEELTDVALDDLTKTMARNIRGMFNAQKGTKDYVEAYKKLKVEVTNTDGSLRDSEQVYWEMIDALGAMENQTEADAVAMLLFGRSAQDLNPIIDIGSKKVKEFASEARRMGAVLSDETLASLGETDDALQRLHQSSEVAKRKIGAEMAPVIERAMKTVTKEISESSEEIAEFAGGAINATAEGFAFVVKNGKEVISVLAGIGTALVVFRAGSAIQLGLTAAVASWRAYKTATEGATVAQWAMNSAQAASPMGLLAVGAGALVAGLTYIAVKTKDATSEFKKFNEEMQESIERTEQDIKSREESKEALEAEYGAAKILADELYNLSDKVIKTSEDKTKMVALVNELNKAIPELNLSINEETGHLTKQRREIYELIEANLELYKVKAAQESLTEIARNQYKAEQDLSKAQEKRIEIQNRVNETYARLNEERRNASYGAGWSFDELQIEKELKTLLKELKGVDNGIEKSKGQIKSLGSEWESTTKYIASNKDLITNSKEISKAVEDIGQSYEKTAETAKLSIDEINKKSQELKENYSDALAKRTEEIKKTYGLFDEVKKNAWTEKDENGDTWFSIEKLYESGQGLKGNLEDQVKSIEDYIYNVEELGKRNISKGLLDELRSMGLGAADEIYALSTLSDEQLSEYDKLWQKKNNLASDLAKDELKGLKNETDAQLNELEKMYYDSGKEAIAQYVGGLHVAVDKKKLEVRRALQGLMNEDIRAGYYDTSISPTLVTNPAPMANRISVFEDIDNFKQALTEVLNNYNYKNDVILDGEKIGEFAKNKVAREMYLR